VGIFDQVGSCNMESFINLVMFWMFRDAKYGMYGRLHPCYDVVENMFLVRIIRSLCLVKKVELCFLVVED